ncbi:MAG: c-type cytochrome [Cyanobacteria bacterium TGS_CYA1]|nr:c-type cytochrome [Cyanobacteria bacterium TGS_CYA1]
MLKGRKGIDIKNVVFSIYCGFALFAIALLNSCAMTEEMRRIQAVEAEKARKAEGQSSNLSGEQIFIRTCNTCHVGGRKGMGPALTEVNEHFPTDERLKAFIRQGVGMMPPQPPEVLNDRELNSLVIYLRELGPRVKEELADEERKAAERAKKRAEEAEAKKKARKARRR